MFEINKLFQSSLICVSKTRAYLNGAPKRSSLKGKLLALPTFVGQEAKIKKSFETVILKGQNELKVVIGKLFQPSLMFVGKDNRFYSLRRVPER